MEPKEKQEYYTSIINEGQFLEQNVVLAIENRLASMNSHKEEVSARLKLLGFYWHQAKESSGDSASKYTKQFDWCVQNISQLELSEFLLPFSSLKRNDQVLFKYSCLEMAEFHKATPTVLEALASLFSPYNKDIAESLYLKILEQTDFDPKILRNLALLYTREALNGLRECKIAAGRKAIDYGKKFLSYDPTRGEKWGLSQDLCKVAILLDDLNSLKEFAELLRSFADETDFNLHKLDAYTYSGVLAVRQNEIALAVTYLKQMESIEKIRNLYLADELFRAGEIVAVENYLYHALKFVDDDLKTRQLEQWLLDIKENRLPELKFVNIRD